MNNKVSKHLKKMAVSEMAMDRSPERDLVRLRNQSQIINAPKSIRAMYQKLKAAYKRLRSSGSPGKQIVVRTRKGSDFTRPVDVTASPARVQSPLKYLRECYRGNRGVSLSYYQLARHAAARGDGATVQRLAMLHA